MTNFILWSQQGRDNLAPFSERILLELGNRDLENRQEFLPIARCRAWSRSGEREPAIPRFVGHQELSEQQGLVRQAVVLPACWLLIGMSY